MARALKVFRTSAGFHDAYVAAPSRKAALEAWGAHVNLFARGMAEQVTDEKLTAEPLKRPGEVIMLSRGGLAEQLKALGPRKKPKPRPAGESAKPAKKRPARPPKRDALDRTEAALEDATQRHEAAIGELETQREKIERKIAVLRSKQAKALAKLERRHEQSREAYRDALERWSDR
jgi:hypothetical protein